MLKVSLVLWLLVTPTLSWAGSVPLLGVGKPPSAGATYIGPVDINGAAVGFWGARSPSSADRGNKLLNVCNSTGGIDVGCADLSSDATTGVLVPATVLGITCPGANCTVKIAYDRSGAGNDMSNATVATRPTLPANVVGTKACMVFSGTQFLSAGSVVINASGSTTTSAVAEDTGSGNFGRIIDADNSGQNLSVNPGNVNQWVIAGMFPGVAASQGVFHNGVSLVTASVGEFFIDGGAGTTGGGTGTFTNGTINIGNTNNFGTPAAFLTGNVCEVAVWNADATANNATLNTNEKTFWGY